MAPKQKLILSELFQYFNYHQLAEESQPFGKHFNQTIDELNTVFAYIIKEINTLKTMLETIEKRMEDITSGPKNE